jgi:hypothetical protein
MVSDRILTKKTHYKINCDSPLNFNKFDSMVMFKSKKQINFKQFYYKGMR